MVNRHILVPNKHGASLNQVFQRQKNQVVGFQQKVVSNQVLYLKNISTFKTTTTAVFSIQHTFIRARSSNPSRNWVAISLRQLLLLFFSALLKFSTRHLASFSCERKRSPSKRGFPMLLARVHPHDVLLVLC